ncbi:MAG: hypothetical protein Fur0026_10250 [Sideroxydans sp.]
MKTYKLQMHFLTPAFLGNAEQSGQWRTPPVKAQLRQWWRMAYFARHANHFDLEQMRQEEGKLFGNAWLDNNFSKSLVRLRLEHWKTGTLAKQHWQALEKVAHPEVRQQAPADLYLGYGPVILPRNAQTPTLKSNAAIQAGETNQLSLAVPDEAAPLIEQALWLMDRYGTLGGRSRNGWGSYSLLPLPSGEGWGEGKAVAMRNWQECLQLDWPHALGQDRKGALIWQTAPHADWKALMKTLAVLKIGLRTYFKFTTGKDAPKPEERHWLSYPVTNHSVKPWGGNARLPNTLRFKVRPTADGQLVGVIFHIPHLPPATFTPNREAVERVWTQVHQFLDAQPLTRIPE